MKLSDDKIARLKQAEYLIAEVQIELLNEQERAKTPRAEETWRDLYWLRGKLGEFRHYGHVILRG
jgi:hypothetical protein